MNPQEQNPPFPPEQKNNSVHFKPIQVVDDNSYQRVFQRGVNRTKDTLDNTKLNIRTDSTKSVPMNNKINN